ncbi:hypothetical protein AAFF_G00329400 [Aldrovandia affinis]|uniref:Uncharacterized protein n=1 Tax=Aldrovandia affinis TaxID=143900 RepID=A0AAD7SLX8_9TELE|nr:hypothetical protein AAFF_G00329400 [Aldrovandia affinis]
MSGLTLSCPASLPKYRPVSPGLSQSHAFWPSPIWPSLPMSGTVSARYTARKPSKKNIPDPWGGGAEPAQSWAERNKESGHDRLASLTMCTVPFDP